MIAVQVRDKHRGDLARIKIAAFQRSKRTRPTIQQHRRPGRLPQMDAGLKAPAAAERVAGARESDGHDARVCESHRLIVRMITCDGILARPTVMRTSLCTGLSGNRV